MQQMPQSRDRVLDFWRGVSILFVIESHAVSFRFKSFFIGLLSWFPKPFPFLFFSISFHAGDVGVGIFLVVSGYIITKILIDEHERTGSINVRRFYVRRFFRILPSYLAYLLCLAGFVAIGWVNPIRFSLACVLFLANTVTGLCGPTIHHFWSLSVEEQFYLTWPFILLFIPRSNYGRLVVVLYVFFTSLSVFINFGHPWAFAAIAAGALYALSPAVRGGIKGSGILGAVLAILLFAGKLFAGLLGLKYLPIRAIFPFAGLYLISQTYRLERFMQSRFFSAIAFLGLMSYSLYIWQNIFIASMKYPSNSPLAWTILLVPASLISYFFIERPAIAWARKKYKAVSDGNL